MPQRRLSARSFALAIIGIVVVFVLLDLLGLTGPLRTITTWIFNPVAEATSNAASSIQGWFRGDEDTEELNFQVRQLEEERNRLLIENAELRSLVQDQASASQQSELLSAKNLRFQVARVIGRSLDPSAQIIIINRGHGSGVFVGQLVVVDDGIVIGRVTSTTSNSSQVLLLTDRRSKIAVEIQNELSSPGILVGERGLAMRVTTIPQDENIAFGQNIVTAGLEAGVPRGLFIGTIGEVNTTPSSLFQSASVRYPISLDRLQLVSVVQGPTPDEQ